MKTKSKAHTNKSDSLRRLFQELLREYVRTKEEREQLARDTQCSESMIKQMVYLGSGGLDQWSAVLSRILDSEKLSFQSLLLFLKTNRTTKDSDKIWNSIREDGATEDEMVLYAMSAKAAHQIKVDLKSKKTTLGKNKSR